ncbi:hypothetical protein BN126_3915 [Cronobacter sakazakii 680]|nr:hypothetical protein BN126_3915 [Cronobacter sakazakii 680]
MLYGCCHRMLLLSHWFLTGELIVKKLRAANAYTKRFG